MRPDKPLKVTLSCSRPKLRLGIAGTPSSWAPIKDDKKPAQKKRR